MKSYQSEGREGGRGGSYSYSPEWKGALEGYTVKVLNRNFWRFSDVMEFDDAYQEAYVKFLELCSKYKGKINSAKWFMSLYKTSLNNRVTDFANHSDRMKRQVSFTALGDIISPDGELLSYQEALPGSTDLERELQFQLKLEQAPPEIRQVLVLLVRSRPDMLAAISDSWTDRGKRMEGGNQFLCNMLGYDAKTTDLEGAVRQYLEE